MTRNDTDDTRTNRRATTDDRENRGSRTDGTMGDVSHTHPETGESFGESRVYERGTVVVVDGGTAESHAAGDDTEGDTDHENEPMGEVDHTPREGAPDANEAYTRGGEHERESGDDTDEEEN